MIGGMFRLAAIQAAVLDVKLKYLNGWHEGRRRNAAMYDELLNGTGVVTPRIDRLAIGVFTTSTSFACPSRDAVKTDPCRPRHRHGDLLSAAAPPAGMLRVPRLSQGGSPRNRTGLPEVLALPIYPELTEEQIRYVAEELTKAVASL